MNGVRIAHLKAHLSRYLAEVRRGKTLIVCDRNTPIARLVPFEEPSDGFVVHEPARPITDLASVRGVKLRRDPGRALDVVRLLRESRDQR
jgi:prevent-host-death family protein